MKIVSIKIQLTLSEEQHENDIPFLIRQYLNELGDDYFVDLDSIETNVICG